MRHFQIQSGMGLGDCVALTGAVRDLKTTFPDSKIEVCQSYQDVWAYNPHVRWSPHKAQTDRIKFPAPFKHHLVECHRLHLEKMFQIQIIRGLDVGELYGPWVRPLIDGDYWVVMAGGKGDNKAKWWPHYQELADQLSDKVKLVHLGSISDHHLPLKGVIDWVGKTTVREHFNVLRFASGLISPITSAVHAIRATGNTAPIVTIGGGLEPVNVAGYPNQTFLHTLGQLSCCQVPCWTDNCPHKTAGFSDCMRLIQPSQVVAHVNPTAN